MGVFVKNPQLISLTVSLDFRPKMLKNDLEKNHFKRVEFQQFFIYYFIIFIHCQMFSKDVSNKFLKFLNI